MYCITYSFISIAFSMRIGIFTHTYIFRTIHHTYIETIQFCSLMDLYSFKYSYIYTVHIYSTYTQYIHIHTYMHTVLFTYLSILPGPYICYLTTCSQPIKVSNPNRTTTLSDLHSLKYTYLHIVHLNILFFRSL